MYGSVGKVHYVSVLNPSAPAAELITDAVAEQNFFAEKWVGQRFDIRRFVPC